jgi:hypothetical protein
MSIQEEALFQRFVDSLRLGDNLLPHYHVPKLIFASSYPTPSSTDANFTDLLVDHQLVDQFHNGAYYTNEMCHSVSRDYFTFTKSTPYNELNFSTKIFEMKNINRISIAKTQEERLGYISDLEFFITDEPNIYFNTVFHPIHDDVIGILEQTENETVKKSCFASYNIKQNNNIKIENNVATNNDLNCEFKAQMRFKLNFDHEIDQV